jgi:ORF6N domain
VVNKIYVIRGQKVMVDNDLADLYEVEARRLKEAVRRNIDRFPADFMFEFTQTEFESLRSQFATSRFKRWDCAVLLPVLTITDLWHRSVKGLFILIPKIRGHNL